jgi:hypothetical protein
MSDHVKVKFLRHAPPFMPGDHSSLPVEKAKALAAKGHVEILGGTSAPKFETGRAEFDPASSPVDEVRLFLAGHGAPAPENTPERKLRADAAAILKGEA